VDGKIFAMNDEGYNGVFVELVDLESMKVIHRLNNIEPTFSFELSPDGKSLLVGEAYGKNRWILYDVATGKELRTIK